ncbi:MAG: pilus assembly PilX N-terminal domain-containing protein [Thermodesulfobacteriota bacterium]
MKTNPGNRRAKDSGMALVGAIAFLAIITLLTTTAYLIASTDLRIAGNYKFAKMAFYQADSGVQYAIGKMEQGLKNGSFQLPTTNSAFTNLFSALPAGYTFSLAPVDMTGPDSFMFRSSGDGPNGAKSTIEATFARDSEFPITYAAFGDSEVDIRANAFVYSYDANGIPIPSPSDSTGEADVGSNGTVYLKNGTMVDGDVALGADASGSEATLDGRGAYIITGEEGVDVPRVDPDPLGAIGGDVEDKINYYADPAHSDNASIPVPSSLTLGNHDTVTLTAGNYYFTDITLKMGSTLNIDASAGPVNIYLTGKMEAKNSSDINITGKPTDFTIFSNSDQDIILKHNSDFKGFIYAPYAMVELKNAADVYGAIWGDEVFIHCGGELYYDVNLAQKFMIQSDDLALTSWVELRT